MTNAKQPCKRGRPVDASKRDQILKVATRLFLKQGLGATSMDQIAKVAGISKLTLYNRFANKNALFVAVISAKSQQYVPDALFDLFNTTSPREAIHTVGRALFALILSDDAMRLYRMIVADATRNPALTQMFYEGAPRRIRTIMAEKMRYLHAHGALHIPDPEAATDLFASLFKGSDLYARALLNIGKKPSATEIDAHLTRATDFFLKACAL